MIRISVIVPIYGIERYLADCVESLLVQTYKNLEIILVDDGSPDGCPEICGYYASIDRRVKVLHKENGGLVSARKAGLKMATGEYVGYVDGDDWIESEMYRHMALIVENTNADLVVSGFKKDIEGKYTEHKNAIVTGVYESQSIKSKILPKFIFFKEQFRPGIFTYVWNKLFRKELLLKAQMKVPDCLTIGEDAACTFQAILRAECIAVTDVNYYHYRQRARSMLKVNGNSDIAIRKVKELYKYLIECVAEEPEEFGLKKQVDQFTLFILNCLTGGVFFQDGKLTSYMYEINENNEKKGEVKCRLAIYGAGTLGQHLSVVLKNLKDYNIVKWVDPDYQECHAHFLRVDSIESLTDVEFDKILIATIDEKEAIRIRERLLMIGINSDKIIMPNFNIQSVLMDDFFDVK